MDKNNIKFLVVEDNAGLLRAISMKMKALGLRCLTATNGEEALSKLSENPDVVWLDIYLPGISGYEFLKKIRESKENRNLPVVVVTNTAGEELRKELEKLGILDFFIKAESRLDDIINRVLGYFEASDKKDAVLQK